MRVVTDGFVPVIVQLICMYEAEWMFFINLGGTAGYLSLVPCFGTGFFYFQEIIMFALFVIVLINFTFVFKEKLK